MADDSTDKIDIATERSRIRHAFWLSIIGLFLAAVLTVFLVWFTDMNLSTPAEVVGIVGLFTSVTGTLVGAVVGHTIGAAAAENERRSRQRAEEVTRRALAHLPHEKAEEVLNPSQQHPVS
jgi:hypothetical protein